MATKESLRQASLAARARGEVLFIPLVASSGTGKTTLANNLGAFLPADYASTVLHNGDVSHPDLVTAARDGVPPPNDPRLVPINIDHREATPPTASELAELKRFLREETVGARCAILWPQTSRDQAEEMARAYEEVAGRPPVDLPVAVEGPDRATWIDTAINTLRLSNQMIDSLELIGVNPRDYQPAAYETLGDFLRQVSDDFAAHLSRLLEESRTPIRLIVVFASESSDAGVLSQLTTGTRYGLLDANALLDATPASAIGRFWSDRRGALTQTIVRLDARALCLPPGASVPALRRHGGEDVVEALKTMGVDDRGSASVSESVSRSDLGRALLGAERATFEARGTPASQATSAFELLAEQGFNLGRDKGHNRSMAGALSEFLSGATLESEAIVPEEGLADSRLIPDNAIPFADYTICLEYTWRRGDFLTTGNRSTIAQYVLEKLKNYASDLGWVRV
jgi:hypothetical protein